MKRVDQALANLLRLGVLTSAAIVLAGGSVYLAQMGREAPHYRVFRGEPGELRSVAGVVGAAVRLESRGLIMLGLLLLLATPVARVVFSVVAFALERDRRYVVITLFVLALLLFSLFGSHS